MQAFCETSIITIHATLHRTMEERKKKSAIGFEVDTSPAPKYKKRIKQFPYEINCNTWRTIVYFLRSLTGYRT